MGLMLKASARRTALAPGRRKEGGQGKAELLMSSKARDLMRHPVLTLAEHRLVSEGLLFLLTHNIHGAPVVSDDGELLGMFSMTDLVKWQYEKSCGHSGGTGRRRSPEVKDDLPGEGVATGAVCVRDIMKPGVITVFEETPLLDVIHTMVDHHIHRVVVVRRVDQKMVGLISHSDLIRVLLRTVVGER